MAKAKAGRLIAGVILFIGAILLVVAVVTPWYSYERSGAGASVTQNSYADLPSTNGSIQYSCSGLPTGASCPSQTSYSDRNLNNTGAVAETGFFMLIAGIVLGFIGAILGVVSRGNSRWTTPAIALGVIALVLAIAAPGLFAASLPGAIAKDTPNHPSNGPWSTFYGSNSTTVPLIGSETITWGPAIGWYLSIAGFAFFLVGVVLLARYRKELPEPSTPPSSMTPEATAVPPPTSPPPP
jgi:hypothetical protein